MRRLALSFSILLSLISSQPVTALAVDLPAAYVRQEVGRHGPLDCGNTFVEFRRETQYEIEAKIVEQGREGLFTTPDNRPYPFGQIYVQDLLRLRDLMRVNDPARRDARTEEVRKTAADAYQRIKREGLLK